MLEIDQCELLFLSHCRKEPAYRTASDAQLPSFSSELFNSSRAWYGLVPWRRKKLRYFCTARILARTFQVGLLLMLNMLIAIMMDIYACTKSCATRSANSYLYCSQIQSCHPRSEPLWTSVMEVTARNWEEFMRREVPLPKLLKMCAPWRHIWCGDLIPALASRRHPGAFCASCMAVSANYNCSFHVARRNKEVWTFMRARKSSKCRSRALQHRDHGSSMGWVLSEGRRRLLPGSP